MTEPDVELDRALEAVAASPPAPPALAARVRERIDTAATHGWHVVLPAEAGSTRIAAGVVALAAARAAHTVDGVRQARVQVAPTPAAVSELRARRAVEGPAPAGIDVPGREVVVTVRLTARGGAPLLALADDVRHAVVAGVRDATGLDVVRTDVHVSDLEEGEPGHA